MEPNDALDRLMDATLRVMARGRWGEPDIPKVMLGVALADTPAGQRYELERLARLGSTLCAACASGCHEEPGMSCDCPCHEVGA